MNAICPGYVWTSIIPGMGDTRAPPEGTPDPPGAPMERWALAEEIATAALYLVSDDAPRRTILSAVAGGYSRIVIQETQGVFLPPGGSQTIVQEVVMTQPIQADQRASTLTFKLSPGCAPLGILISTRKACFAL